MQKYSLVLVFWVFFFMQAQAEDVHCSWSETAYDLVTGFGRMIWEPNINSECTVNNIPAECESYVSRLQKEGKDWRSYLRTCESRDGQPMALYPLSCTKTLEEMIVGLVESSAQEELRQAANEDCSKSMIDKKLLLHNYNKSVPELLQITDERIKADLFKGGCDKMLGFFKGHTRQRMYALNQKLAFYSETTDLSAQQKQYLQWKNQMLAPFKPQGPIFKATQEALATTVKEWSCMTDYRKTQLACEKLQELLVAGRLLRVGSGVRTAENLASGAARVSDADAEALRMKLNSPNEKWDEMRNRPTYQNSPQQKALLSKIDQAQAEMRATYFPEIKADLRPWSTINFYHNHAEVQGIVKEVTADGIRVQTNAGEDMLVPLESNYDLVSRGPPPR